MKRLIPVSICLAACEAFGGLEVSNGERASVLTGKDARSSGTLRQSGGCSDVP